MTEDKVKDLQKAVKALEDYENLYNFMAVGSQIHTTFEMLNRTMNQNFPVPTIVWRFSPEYDMDKKLFEAEALFNVYYKFYDAASGNNDWLLKIETDLGKHMNYLFGLFPRDILLKYSKDIPNIMKFVR